MRTLPTRLLLVLGLLSASAPLAIDFYLASLPRIGTDLQTGASNVQLTLTAFLVGLAAGQVVWGPVSDRYGRWRPMLIGSTVAALAAVLAALAPTVELLIAARFVQAAAAAAGMVMGRAIIADVLEGFAAARAMSITMSINGLAPIVAPVLGGALADVVPWRGILGIVAAIAVVQAVCAFAFVRETHPPEKRTPKVDFADLGRLFTRPAFTGYLLTQAFGFATLMAYVSSSSFVYQSIVGASPTLYGIGFGINGTAMLVASAVSARLARHKVHPARVVTVALPVLITAAVVVLLVAVLPVPKVLVVPAFLAVTSSVGFVLGNVGALAVESARPSVGSGSALLGGVMFLAGGIASPLGGVAGEHTAVPLGLTMVVAAVLARVSFGLARHSVARDPEAEKVFA